MTEEKLYESNKKIATRFLKEIGLYTCWLKYLGATEIKGGRMYYNSDCQKHNWYKREYIDDVFSKSSFTKFLTNECGLNLRSYITDLFRLYLRVNDAVAEYRLNRTWNDWLSEALSDVIIDKETGSFKLREEVMNKNRFF